MRMSGGSKHLIAGVVWVALMGVAYLVMDALRAPKIGMVRSGEEILIPRSADGHFYIRGIINDHEVVFLVDTGATTTSIGVDAARAMQLGAGRAVTVNTANGAASGMEYRDATLRLGHITIRRVNLIALPALRDRALLGQNVLQHLEVTQTSDSLRIRARKAPQP